MSRLVQSLVLLVLTHTTDYTPLHSTSTPAIFYGCDHTGWRCMLAWQAGGGPITIISHHANIVIEK